MTRCTCASSTTPTPLHPAPLCTTSRRKTRKITTTSRTTPAASAFCPASPTMRSRRLPTGPGPPTLLTTSVKCTIATRWNPSRNLLLALLLCASLSNDALPAYASCAHAHLTLSSLHVRSAGATCTNPLMLITQAARLPPSSPSFILSSCAESTTTLATTKPSCGMYVFSCSPFTEHFNDLFVQLLQAPPPFAPPKVVKN